MSIQSRKQAKSIAANNLIMNNQMFDLSSKLSDEMKNWKPKEETVQLVQQSFNDDRDKFRSIGSFTKKDEEFDLKSADLSNKLDNLNNMSFNGAFSTAKNLGLSEFTWKGKKYTTETKEEQDRRLASSSGGSTNTGANSNSSSGLSSQETIGLRENRPTLVYGDLPDLFNYGSSFTNKNFNGQIGYNVSLDFDTALSSRNLKYVEGPYINGKQYHYIIRTNGNKPKGNALYNKEDIVYSGTGALGKNLHFSRYVPSRRSGGKFPVFRNGGIIGLI